MIVTGIDLASVHSAICTLRVPDAAALFDPLAWEMKELDWIDVQEDTTQARIRAAYAFSGVVKTWCPTLVSVEDFTRQHTSFDSYNAGELGGMLRMLLWQMHQPFLLVSPMRLKMFLHHHNKTPIHKDDVAFSVQAYFGYKSDASTKKHREDATDAFALAQLARAFLSYDQCSSWANAKQKKTLDALRSDIDLLLPGEPIQLGEVPHGQG